MYWYRLILERVFDGSWCCFTVLIFRDPPFNVAWTNANGTKVSGEQKAKHHASRFPECSRANALKLQNKDAGAEKWADRQCKCNVHREITTWTMSAGKHNENSWNRSRLSWGHRETSVFPIVTKKNPKTIHCSVLCSKKYIQQQLTPEWKCYKETF